jgi:hypothetical protein
MHLPPLAAGNVMTVLLQSIVSWASLLPVLLGTFVQLTLVGLLFVLEDPIVWLHRLFQHLVLLEHMHQQLRPIVLLDVYPVVSDTIPLLLARLSVPLARSTPTPLSLTLIQIPSACVILVIF